MRITSGLILLIIVTFSACNTGAEKQSANMQDQKDFNPLIPDNLADPSVVMFADTFYMYATTDIDRGLSEMGPPVVWKSQDFVNWSFDGTIMPQIDWNTPHTYLDEDGNEQSGYFRYWAPGKPLEKNGMFYLFPTIVQPDETMGTYVVEADHPEGPFDFVTGSGICFNEDCPDETQPLIGDIDGEPFIDDNGEAYIYWRRRYAAKLSDDFLSLEGETITIPTTYGGYSEGPVMFKRNDIYYYVYTLSGHANYCNGYMMSTESPLGPFTHPEGESIFIYSNIDSGVWGPGHGNVFRMPGTDDYFFLYLEYGEGGTTRQVFANKMEFNEDGTIKPIRPDFKGVGFLGPDQKPSENIALKGTASSSGYKPEKIVEASILTNPNEHETLRVRGNEGVEVNRTFTYTPGNAIDGSGFTRWRAADDADAAWFTLDFGKKQQVDRCEMFFVFPAFGHAWQLEKSNDGQDWEVCATQENTEVRSPHVASQIGETRYLRLTITDGEPGLWEFKVY